MRTMEVVGLISIFFLIVFAAIGGLGGGGSQMPICMIFFGFDVKQSIGLSNASICVCSIYRYLYNFNVPHPLKNGQGVLVDYNVAAIMLPMAVVGASVGVIVNIILPEPLIILILCLLISVVSFITSKKWCRIVDEERGKLGPVCCGKKGKEETE